MLLKIMNDIITSLRYSRTHGAREGRGGSSGSGGGTLPVDDTFWTPAASINNASDAQIAFVSPLGNDDLGAVLSRSSLPSVANRTDPRTTDPAAVQTLAFRTLEAAFAAVDHNGPSIILGLRGHTYDERLESFHVHGRSATEKFWLTAYGTGSWPVLKPTADGVFVSQIIYAVDAFTTGGSVNHVAITDWEIDGTAAPTIPAYCVTIQGVGDDVLFEGCHIHGGRGQLSLDGSSGGTVRVRAVAGVEPNSDAGNAQCFYCQGWHVVFQECVGDFQKTDGSTNSTPYSTLNHDFYIHDANTTPVMRGCVVARSSGSAVQFRSQGTTEGNLFLQNEFSLSQVQGLSRYNVFLGNRPGSDFGEGRAMNGSSDALNPWSGYESYENIWSGAGGTCGANQNNSALIVGGGHLRSISIHDDTVYDWYNATAHDGTALDLFSSNTELPADEVTVSNCTFNMPNGGYCVNAQGPGDSNHQTYASNYYNGVGSCFRLNGGGTGNFATWVSSPGASGDSSQFAVNGIAIDPTRNLRTFMTSIGVSTSSMEDAHNKYLAQKRIDCDRLRRDHRYSVWSVINYIRAGHGRGPVPDLGAL